MLPTPYIQKMETLLKEEAPLFFQSYEEVRSAGIRIHSLKITNEQWESIAPFPIEKIPFVHNGYYYSYGVEEPGKHPYHFAGLYYIQEPSAMFIAEQLNVTSEDRVLDLCAAPGGKTTQLATLMNNEGLLISNEIHPKRAKALSENVERFGLKNTIVLNETPERLSKTFPAFFTKILVDAPCSGEGMFRKDEETRKYWSQSHVEELSELQSSILDHAYHMLQPGGTIVYSTCTFSPEENEQVIEAFLCRHEDMELVEIKKRESIEGGQSEWTKSHLTEIQKTARLWPHKLKGEGHFVAKLVKQDSVYRSHPSMKGLAKKIGKKEINDFFQFQQSYITGTHFERLQLFGSQLYEVPNDCPDLKGLKVVRPGLHLGELKKNRFEPNHALALFLSKGNFIHTYSLQSNDEDWKRFIKGETLKGNGEKGWTLVTIDDFPLGWGKITDGILKNYYPKGLRIPF